MKYLKKFETENDRNTYENSESYIEPYVSYVDGGDVHYNKPPFFCRLTLSDDSVVEIEGSGELMGSQINPYRGSGITSIEIGGACTSIGNTAVASIKTLENVIIGENVTSIGGSAFISCDSLTSVTIPDSVTTIGVYAFGYCESLTGVTIPSGVTDIGAWAFAYCYGITNVTIPSGVTIINYNVFNGCRSLTSVTIPSGVTSIGKYAFSSCGSLTSVTIPSGVTDIGYNAFNSCTGLTSVTILAATPPSIDTIFYYASECPIYVPAESVDAYKAASDWSSYASRIQAIPTT